VDRAPDFERYSSLFRDGSTATSWTADGITVTTSRPRPPETTADLPSESVPTDTRSSRPIVGVPRLSAA
jgi:hypothetical protein